MTIFRRSVQVRRLRWGRRLGIGTACTSYAIVRRKCRRPIANMPIIMRYSEYQDAYHDGWLCVASSWRRQRQWMGVSPSGDELPSRHLRHKVRRVQDISEAYHPISLIDWMPPGWDESVHHPVDVLAQHHYHHIHSHLVVSTHLQHHFMHTMMQLPCGLQLSRMPWS
jgi:hypothetical protein